MTIIEGQIIALLETIKFILVELRDKVSTEDKTGCSVKEHDGSRPQSQCDSERPDHGPREWSVWKSKLQDHVYTGIRINPGYTFAYDEIHVREVTKQDCEHEPFELPEKTYPAGTEDYYSHCKKCQKKIKPNGWVICD